MDDAIAQSADQLDLQKVGRDKFSAEAIERLHESIRQLDRGESISGDEVGRKFDEWLKRLEARNAAEI